MFRKRTVFIVGAGANHEYGMPLGVHLRDQIHQITLGGWDYHDNRNGNQKFWRSMQQQLDHRGLREAVDAGLRLRNVIKRYDSVDEALHFFAEDSEVVRLGKSAIAYLLMEQERNSLLFDPQNQPLSKLGPPTKWMEQFFRMAASGLRKSDFQRGVFENVSVIDFNYDRCLQHYVLGQLQRLDFSVDQSLDIVRTLDVIKPYGSLGALPWQSDRGTLHFGGSATIAQIADNLRTFTEGQSDKLSEIRSALNGAKVTVILGFGFHQQNIRMLRNEMPGDHQSFATALGYASENYSTLEQALLETFGLSRFDSSRINPKSSSEYVKLHNLEAGKMLDQLYFAISAAVS